MSTAYASRADRAKVAAFEADNLPCRFCGAMTDRKTLSDLGARCEPCYDAYIGRDPHAPQLSADEKRAALLKLRGAFGSTDNPRRWAERLRYVEERRGGMLPAAKHAGKPHTAARTLTPFQREAWREALRVQAANQEASE